MLNFIETVFISFFTHFIWFLVTFLSFRNSLAFAILKSMRLLLNGNDISPWSPSGLIVQIINSIRKWQFIDTIKIMRFCFLNSFKERADSIFTTNRYVGSLLLLSLLCITFILMSYLWRLRFLFLFSVLAHVMTFFNVCFARIVTHLIFGILWFFLK